MREGHATELARRSAGGVTDPGGGGRRGVLARYASFLPVTPATPALTLLEGDTPLLHVPRLARWVGVDELWVKFEGTNPTGSFKDRGMVVAVAKAVERGIETVLCASTGNTAASAAAYAARAGLSAVVLLPRGGVAGAKVSQALAYGAQAITIDGNFDAALDVARGLTERYPVELVNSVNPHRIAGQATAAYEICEVLGCAPDVLSLPVGNGGNISAYWAGFHRFHDEKRVSTLPMILGAQAAGAAPLVHGHPIEHPDTIASAIRIGRPASWDTAVGAIKDSGGVFLSVSDDEILAAYSATGRCEGIFCEPASAAGIAALRRSVAMGTTRREQRCVCVCTGHGLKDPQYAPKLDEHTPAVAATVEAVLGALRGAGQGKAGSGIGDPGSANGS
jgi:threonine synthase